MSINGIYRRLPPEEFTALQADPAAADAYFGRAFEDDSEIGPYYDALEASGFYLDIMNDWQGLHFLLTGRAEMDTTEEPPPLGNVVLGGTPTTWEATYGMVRSLTPAEVRDVANTLQQITEYDLRPRLNVAAFSAAHIYPHNDNWDSDELDLLLEVFDAVRDFFVTAAEQGEVVLLSHD